MSLEAQSVDADILKKQQEDLAKSLMDHLNKRFWAALDTPKKHHTNDPKDSLLKKLIENLQKKK
jgi:hypothetical protein